jgi:hypothetical protein
MRAAPSARRACTPRARLGGSGSLPRPCAG